MKGTPKVEFNESSNRWSVEYQSSAQSPVTVTVTDKKQTVYVLGCVGATIVIAGKCNGIVVDTCKRTEVHCDTVMASVEVVNSQRIHVHVREKAASVAIDKTDGIVVHLPPTSLDSEIVASKSSEMNISWLDEASGEVIERAIPEQYVHRIKGTSVTANVSDLYH